MASSRSRNKAIFFRGGAPPDRDNTGETVWGPAVMLLLALAKMTTLLWGCSHVDYITVFFREEQYVRKC